MGSVLDFVRLYGGQFSAIGAALVFLFGVYKYLHDQRQFHRWKEFEVFHKLVRELVEPDAKDQAMYIDRQAAVIFELRSFKRYYPYTLRMLLGLRGKWGDGGVREKYPRLVEELNLTIAYLERKGRWRRNDG